MATDHKRDLPASEHSAGGDGFGKWLVSALGLVWIIGLASRASHRHRSTWVGSNRLRAHRGPSQILRETVQSLTPPRPGRGHEQRDANAKWIFGMVLLLFVFLFFIQAVLVAWLNSLKHTPTPTDAWRPARPSSANFAPLPRLQLSPPGDLQSFRAREEAELHSYGWIDRTAGVVRIPIERAMDLVLQQGLPTRTTTNPVQLGPSSYELIRQRADHRENEIKGGP